MTEDFNVIDEVETTDAVKPISKPSRFSFRLRLTAMIAAVFILGGVSLIAVQYWITTNSIIEPATPELISRFTSEDNDGIYSASVPGSLEVGKPITVKVILSDGKTADLSSDMDIDQSGVTTYWVIASDSSNYEEGIFVGGPPEPLPDSITMSFDLTQNLLIGSTITLSVFAILAIGAAYWLSGRSLRRVKQITQATQTITADDLDQRLDLSGPKDEIKSLGDTINSMLDRLGESFTRQRSFIANASHELRTPLTTTRASLEIPLAQGLVPNELKPDIERALAANRRSGELIAALLTLAHVDQVGSTSTEDVDVAKLLEKSVQEHQAKASERNVSVSLNTDEAIIIKANPALAQLAVDNLMGNAIDHNQAGGSITVSSGQSENTTFIQIENTGRELSAQEVAGLTEPFNRGTESRLASSDSSIGLGLTLVSSIARAEGANFTIAPGEPNGLIARLEFPR